MGLGGSSTQVSHFFRRKHERNLRATGADSSFGNRPFAEDLLPLPRVVRAHKHPFTDMELLLQSPVQLHNLILPAHRSTRRVEQTALWRCGRPRIWCRQKWVRRSSGLQRVGQVWSGWGQVSQPDSVAAGGPTHTAPAQLPFAKRPAVVQA